MRLYDLTAEYRRFSDQLDEMIEMVAAGEIPASVITDTAEALSGEIEEKMDGIACIIKEADAEAAAIRAEENNLAARRKVLESKSKRLTAYLMDAMIRTDRAKLETARNKVTFRRTKAVELKTDFLAWAQENRPDLLKVTTEVSKTAVKAAIEAGDELPGAEITERRSLVVK